MSSGASILYTDRDVTHTTATDIVGLAAIVVQRGMTKLRISICPSAAGKLSVKFNGQSTGSQFNDNANLTVDALAQFDLDVKHGDSVAFYYSADATLRQVNIKGIFGEAM